MTEQEERGSFSQWFDDVGHGLGLNKAVAWTVWQRAWQARASLAQVGEPVAWQWRFRAIGKETGPWNEWADGRAPQLRSGTYEVEERPLYSAAPAPVGVDAAGVSKAAADVLAERSRQVEVEGWTPSHDDEHTDGEMAVAAGCYAMGSGAYWPMSWDFQWWKPKNRRQDLVRAGALIIAEIERLDRAALSAAGITDTRKE